MENISLLYNGCSDSTLGFSALLGFGIYIGKDDEKHWWLLGVGTALTGASIVLYSKYHKNYKKSRAAYEASRYSWLPNEVGTELRLGAAGNGLGMTLSF